VATTHHPTFGRVHVPRQHRTTVTILHRIARASSAPVFDPTPQERLLLAIFGLKDGETWAEALVSMRTKPGPKFLSAITDDSPCDGSHGRFCPECAAINRWRRD